MWLNFDSKHDFKEKNLTISMKDLKDIYDTDGNMMHDSKSSFYVKSFIKYPDHTRNLVKWISRTCKQI